MDSFDINAAIDGDKLVGPHNGSVTNHSLMFTCTVLNYLYMYMYMYFYMYTCVHVCYLAKP